MQEYVNNFLEGEPSPGIAYEHKLVQALVPSITATEVASAAKTAFADVSRVILGVSPQKADIKVPTDAQLKAAVTGADTVAVTAWADTASSATLLDKSPDPGTVVNKREIPELGITIVRFSNGVEAWLKPTDFKNDQVLFSFVASGGSSLQAPEKFVEAQLATGQVELSGAGGHRAIDLPKLTAGKIASAVPFISLSSHGIQGLSTPANIETALQLLYMKFAAPGNEAEAFALIKRQLEAAVVNRLSSPGAVYGDKLGEVNTLKHYTSRPLTVERIASLDRDAMVSFYRERFSNAADFTMFMVGTFKIDDVVPLIGRYVGSLPSTGKMTSRYKDVGITFPSTTERVRVAKGKEPKSQTVVSFFADPPIEEHEQTRIEAATEVLEIALRDILREELGETYSVSVGLAQSPPQRGGGHVEIAFGGSPDNADKMVARVLQEVARLQKEGPTEDLTNRAKETARRTYETSVKQNGYWLGRMQSAKLLDRDPMLMLTRLQRIDAVTPAILHETFKKYFPAERFDGRDARARKRNPGTEIGRRTTGRPNDRTTERPDDRTTERPDDRVYRLRYLKLTTVSSSITSGLTNRCDEPARGTSIRTGSTPDARRCRFCTFIDGSCAWTCARPSAPRARALLFSAVKLLTPDSVFEISADCVLTSGASAVTVTVSEAPPTAIWKSIWRGR